MFKFHRNISEYAVTGNFFNTTLPPSASPVVFLTILGRLMSGERGLMY